MKAPLEYCLVNLTVHSSRAFALEVLHGPISGSNFAIFHVTFARIRGFASKAPEAHCIFGVQLTSWWVVVGVVFLS